VRYASAVAFRQALDQRLKDEAEQTGLALARLRKRVAFELFLRRLVAVAPDRWILKGALALDFRLGVATRATKDIDLGRDDNETAAIDDINAAEQLALDDFFTFAALRTDDHAGNDEFSAIRFHVTAQLAGRTFDKFVLDIGFGDPLVGRPDTIATSDLLAFAGIEPVHVPAVPLSQHLAEKVHAYTRTYGEAQQPSTRPKDLIDILLIASVEPLAAAELREALERTFTSRAGHALPGSLPPPPPAWANPYARLAAQVGLDADLAAAFAHAAAFVDPVLDGSAAGHWAPERGSWAT